MTKPFKQINMKKKNDKTRTMNFKLWKAQYPRHLFFKFQLQLTPQIQKNNLLLFSPAAKFMTESQKNNDSNPFRRFRL